MERAQAAEGSRAQGRAEPLLSLQQHSLELGRVALMAGTDHKPQPVLSPLLLLKQLERMKRLKSALENRIRAGEHSADDFPSENLTKEFMAEAVATLEKEIQELKISYQNKTLLLRRMQLYDAVHKKLLQKDTESKLIYETIEHSGGLCKHILKSQKETVTLEEKLTDVRKKRMELKETCAAVMSELKAANESANSKFSEIDTQNFRNINKYIAVEIDMVTVIQNVFQRLILGSQVNWAEDPKLKEIVLTLGRSPV